MSDGYYTAMVINKMFDIECSSEEAIELEQTLYSQHKQQLASAHRQGWEQCQKAAIIKTMEHHQDFMFGSSIPTVCQDIAYAIAAMEYKGESK